MPHKIFATFFFERKLKSLCRKYRHIFEDYRDLLALLENNIHAGVRIKGCNGPIFKVRMPSRDMQRGKSGGYRVIYLVDKGANVYLLTIYPKSEREDIDAKEINELLVKTNLNQ